MNSIIIIHQQLVHQLSEPDSRYDQPCNRFGYLTAKVSILHIK